MDKWTHIKGGPVCLIFYTTCIVDIIHLQYK